MSLLEALGYRHRPPNGLHRAVQAVAATSPGSWAFSKASPPLDRWAFRVSEGRWTLASALAGLPVVMLTTTGARSGLERETPLVGIPHGVDFAIIGSGYGQRATPAWVHNLRARPIATVSYRSVAADVVATEVADPASVWEQARAIYPGYAAYPRRAAHRDIAVFVLRPTP
ncbi:MAG: nitroreductase/quinone reductase family protein [Acidimicrobiia bacterium]